MEVRNILVAASVPKMANIVIDRVIWVKFILDYGLIFYFSPGRLSTMPM